MGLKSGRLKLHGLYQAASFSSVGLEHISAQLGANSLYVEQLVKKEKLNNVINNSKKFFINIQ